MNDSSFIASPMSEIVDFIPLKNNQIELVAKDALSSLFARHAFGIWKMFCLKQDNVLLFLIVSVGSLEVLTEL